MQIQNLFANAAPPDTGETFETLLSHENLVIERILSSAKIVSKEYVQAQAEWVLLLKGEAILDIAGEIVQLTAGDYVFLPAGQPHTVQSVSAGAIWLAIHLHPDSLIKP